MVESDFRELSDAENERVCDAVWSALEVIFGWSRDDIALVFSSGEVEADVPRGESVDAAGAARLYEGVSYEFDGRQFEVVLDRIEDNFLYLKVNRELPGN